MKAVLVLIALTSLAHADEPSDTIAYRVKTGETLDVIAAEFYGDHTRTMFIVTENKLKKGRPVSSGERLRVPATREIATDKGDTFATLAQTYLGDDKRAGYLADYNGMAPDDNLATGTSLQVPFRVTHVAANTESLASIATAYYGEAKQAETLRKLNGLDKSTIDKGESIQIFALKLHSLKQIPLDAEAAKRKQAQHDARTDTLAALPRARSAWAQGDFATVKTALALVGEELEYLDLGDAVEVGLLLARAHVAFDETDQAVEKFTAVRERNPHLVLTRYSYSPKVIDVWKKAGGRVEGD